MTILTILLFFIYTWGIGFTATYYLKKPDNLIERFFLNIGIGLSILPILVILLNLFRIPLDWKILFVLSLVFPLFILYKKRKQLTKPQFKLTKSDLTIGAAILISLISFSIYATGAFSYPYLENEDPWGHAVGIKYVAMEKSAYDPPLTSRPDAIDPVLAYIDPYPPAYDILLGILHQTSPDIMWTMKFFNALIISLGFVFFYLLAKQFTDRNKALLATAIFAMIPSYLTHFIWAHVLAITLFFPTMIAFERSQEDKKWLYIATILVASVWVSQNIEQPLKITTMIFLYLVITSISQAKLWKSGFAALAAGIFVSFAWWGAMLAKYGITGFVHAWQPKIAAAGTATVTPGLFDRFISVTYALVNPGGTASRAYTFSDFFIAHQNNMINSPIGIGIVLTLVSLAGIALVLWKYRSNLLKHEQLWLTVTLFWLVYTFWGVNGMTFPIPIARGAFRMWLLLAIPVALIAAEGIYLLKSYAKSRAAQSMIVIILLIGIFATSGYQKYTLNTAAWPTSGAFAGSEPVEYAAWFNTIPHETKVFLYAPRDKLTIGFGKFSCIWCDDEIAFRDDILNKNAEEVHSFLKQKEYEYFIINSRMDTRDLGNVFGANRTSEVQQRYNEFAESGLFEVAYQKQNMFAVLKVT